MVLFDKWSLKDSVAHLSGWNLQRVSELHDFMDNRPIDKITDYDAFNDIVVGERKKLDWDAVYTEFVMSCENLVSTFESIPEDLMNKKVWEDSSTTPAKWLKIDIEHMQGEHLAQLRDFKA